MTHCQSFHACIAKNRNYIVIWLMFTEARPDQLNYLSFTISYHDFQSIEDLKLKKNIVIKHNVIKICSF